MARIAYVLLLTGVCQWALAETIKIRETYSDPLRRAIRRAAPGDTILVAAGKYQGGINIDKPLTLLGAGADKTRVFAPIGLFGIHSEGVTIEGFHLSSNSHGMSLVRTITCDRCSAVLKHNIIDSGHYAVEVLNPSHLTLNYNQLFGNVGVESINNPYPIDARFNWWGTTDEDGIREKIWSRWDNIDYSFWLSDPDDIFAMSSTGVLPLSWGRLKRRY